MQRYFLTHISYIRTYLTKMSCPINQKPQSSLRQLYRTLKMKMIDAYKAGKGCKKILKSFQVPSSSVWNVMKKGQLTETVRNG